MSLKTGRRILAVIYILFALISGTLGGIQFYNTGDTTTLLILAYVTMAIALINWSTARRDPKE